MEKYDGTCLISISIQFVDIGQISNKFDLLYCYKSNILYSDCPKTFKTDLNVNVPTILGNLKHNQGLYMGLLYSDISFNYQPGLVIGYNKYSGNDRLEDMYDNLKLSTTSVGFINKYNFLNMDIIVLCPMQN